MTVHVYESLDAIKVRTNNLYCELKEICLFISD